MRSLEVPMTSQHFQETRFAEFFSIMAGCLRDSIGINTENISGFQLRIGGGTLPIRKQPKDRGGGFKPFNRTSLAQQYRRVMTAIDVLQRSCGIAIAAEEKCGIAIVRGVFVEL